MKLFRRIRARLERRPPSAEDIAAREESERVNFDHESDKVAGILPQSRPDFSDEPRR